MIEAGALGLAAASAAGLISFVSPCVLRLVPAYVSYVAGQPLDAGRADAGRRLAALTLGASATFLGRLLLQYRYEANLIGGEIVVVFGLLMLGMMRVMPWLMRDLRFHPHVGGRPLRRRAP